jgi:hypothetical protein
MTTAWREAFGPTAEDQLPPRDLPRSPLPPEPYETGLRWDTYDTRRTIRERRPEQAHNERGARLGAHKNH